MDLFVPIVEPTTSMAATSAATVITITLQYGSHREKLVMERVDSPQAFELFGQKARQLVERAAEEGITAWADVSAELLLFRHDYGSPNLLQRLNNLTELDNGSVVEIIRVTPAEQQTVTSPHNVHVASYKTPTFCDYCGEILVGLIKQGLKCSFCNCNFHKKCAYAARNNCAKNDTVSAAASITPPSNGSKMAYELPHTLTVHSYKTPTVCKVCDKMLLGLIKQGMKCRDCNVNVHQKCAAFLPRDCHVGDNGIVPQFDQMSVAESAIAASAQPSVGSLMDVDPQPPADMIPLARLPGSANTRSAQVGATCEGWMVHFLLSNPSRRFKHYWVLGNGLISLYNEYNDGVNPSRVFKQIPLADILAVRLHTGAPVDPRYPPHCFEIRIRSAAGPADPDAVHCVGENLEALRNGNSTTPSAKTRGLSWQQWVAALQNALQPPALRTDPANAEPALQFSQLYQIVREKVLGSGQFGTVFHGIHRQSSRAVAIKVIPKDRFSKKGSSGVETLKSEVAILQTLDHPGIIKLESMFETKDKIFVVMEKMNGDMLEMILSRAAGRLDERSTKYLIVQILSALRYLHSRSIAHCDLKPENVLLSDLQTNLPQTKICDFGYARFIGDAQFRKTIVGTPAYMAPELLQKKSYNRSLDLWSVGVIIYVTLSGTFPFNDGEEIAEQIQNASFMFPHDLWKDTSQMAIDLIQKLLKVQMEERLTIDETLRHPWLIDPHVNADLQQLEARVGFRYLTGADMESPQPGNVGVFSGGVF